MSNSSDFAEVTRHKIVSFAEDDSSGSDSEGKSSSSSAVEDGKDKDEGKEGVVSETEKR